MGLRSANRWLCAAAALALAFPIAPQQGTTGWDEFSTNSNVVSDEFSTNCSAKNQSPYAGMNPITCRGVMMPADSQGRCTGSTGWRLLRKDGNTCYFCMPVRPAPGAIVIPLDQLQQARVQGYVCGVDETNPNCTAVCTRQSGSGPYIPPAPPNQRQKAPILGGVTYNDVPCPGGLRIPRENYVYEAAKRLRKYACRWDNNSNDYVCCPRPYWTGYEGPIPTPAQIANPNYNGSPCANPTPPPECKQGGPKPGIPPTPPPRPSGSPAPIRDGLQYLQGMQQGLGDCAKAGLDLFAAAASMARGDFATASQLLGLLPGQSITLRTIFQEAQTKVLGVSPFEAGRIAGRRICAYGLIPGIGKAAKSLRGIRTSGATPYNPVRGAAIAENSGALAGKWIRTPNGTVQLGRLRGSGALGDVYDIVGRPGRVMKVSNAKPISAPSFPRQVAGSSALKSVGVATPQIYDSQFGGPGEPSFLVMDDIGARWPGAQIFSDVQKLGPAEIGAIQNLYTQIGDNGLVWADGHSSNIFFTNGPGGLTAGVVDSDMVFPASQFGAQDAFVKNTVGNILMQAGQQGLLFRGFNAQQVMNALFQARFP